MKIPNSGFMEDINKTNKQDKIFSVPVTLENYSKECFWWKEKEARVKI